MSTVNDIQKIDVKVFVTEGQDIDPYEFVPVLQRWIQEHTVPGTLIDVADYSHMHHGPGVILVAHEYNLSIDYAEGRMGVLFHYKRPAEATFGERVKSAVEQARNAAKLLEQEELSQILKFDTDSLRIIVNDRLLAPNDDATAAELESAVAASAGGAQRVANDARERLAYDIG
jgi:hypothetical protein